MPSITSPTSHLEAIETRAAAWLADHRRFLDPAEVGSDHELFARKALVETALLLGLKARLDGPLTSGPYRDLLATVATVAARPSYRELVSRDRRALLLYAGTHAALRLCGREDPDFADVVERTVRGRYTSRFERVPYRHLDLLHTLELAGVDTDAPPLEDVLPLCLVTGDPNVLELTTNDTYAITHAVFYATDFGQRPAPWPAGVTDAGVAGLLEGCLALARAREDADLVGELLICLTCVGATPAPAVEECRAWMADWQEASGRVMGPPGVVPARLTEADPEWASWAEAYHTTIVAALEALLRRAVPAGEDAGAPAEDGGIPGVDDALDRAAGWLVGHADGHPAHVRATAWAAAGWATIGATERARAAIEALRDLPEVVAGPMALHVSSLASRLGCGWGDDVLADAAAALASADPSDTTLDGARHHLRVAGLDVPGGPGRVSALELGEPDGDVRERATVLCADLLTRGPSPEVEAPVGGSATRLLVRAVREAVDTYDLALLALALRGLTRLPGAPPRLLRDGADFLVSQQDRHGAIGAPLSDDPAVRGDLQVRWTAVALPALLEVRTRLRQ